MLGEDQHSDLQRQLEFDDHTLVLCSLAALTVSNRVGESGKTSKSFTKIIQVQKTLTLAVNRTVLDPEVRQILIESLAFENANSKYKKVIRFSKATSIDVYDATLMGK